MILYTLQSGQTALLLAVHCGSKEVINLLRKASASADIQGKVWFPTIVMFMISHDYNYYEKNSNNKNTCYTDDDVD